MRLGIAYQPNPKTAIRSVDARSKRCDPPEQFARYVLRYGDDRCAASLIRPDPTAPAAA